MISGANYREGVALSPDGAVYVTLASGSTIPSPTFTGTVKGAEYQVAQWGIPVLAGPSGTMANNGAVTWGTALRKAYTGGAWVLLPAGAIAAGVPAAAAFLWYVGTDTLHGTFFNSSYTTGIPTVGTATPFVTTGSGAFVGSGTELGITIPIGANVMGPNGVIQWDFNGTNNNTVNTKNFKVHYSAIGGAIVYFAAPTTTTFLAGIGFIRNQAATNSQVSGVIQSVVGDTQGVQDMTVDTTAATTLVLTMSRGTATDWQCIEGGRVLISYGA